MIAFLFLLSCSNTALSQSDSDPNVIFSLKEWAHWAPVVGVDDPALTLYDNRDLIYYDTSTWDYEYVRLTEDEYARLKEELIPKDLPAIEHFYMRSYATCQNEYYFYFGGESERLVTVYGHPTDDDWLYSYNIPQSLRRCFNMLTEYRNQRAVPWFPEKFEVLVWDMFPSDHEYPQWPSDWPDLNSPDTIIGTQVHSIFLPSDLFDEFIALGDEAEGIVMMNGKPMCIWYRMPIPGEEVFDQQFEEPDYENTPLHDAARFGKVREVESLLAGGADINARRADGKTALHLAAEKGHTAIAGLLAINGAYIEAKTPYGNTPLLCALDLVQADTAGLLLERGADVNVTNSMGDYPLHYATDDNLIDTVAQLTAAGLDVEARNDANDTPLHCASRDGAAAVVELLLAEGAEINAAKPDGRTALHAAAFHNHTEVVEYLLANGADINAQTTEAHTPLDYALMAGRAKIVTLLESAEYIVSCFEADGEIISTPAIGEDGTVYFGTQNATLYAVDPIGNLKWTWKYDSEGWGPLAFEAAPVIGDDGTIHVADDIAIPNYLFAISPEGEKKWEYETHVVYGSMDASPALLSDGTIFAGGYGGGRRLSGQLVALSPNGGVLEGFPIHTGPIFASPAVVDDVVIAGENNWPYGRSRVFAVTKSAAILWRTELDGDVDGSRVFSLSSLAVDHKNNVYVANTCADYFPETGPPIMSSTVVQLDPLTGEKLCVMEIPIGSIVVGSPVIDAAEFGANVIVATQNAHVISLNPYADGVKLNYDLVLGENSEAAGSPVIGDNGKIYHAVNSVGDANQIDVFEINPDGTINDAFSVTIMNNHISSSLTMDNNGVLYFGTKEGRLCAVQTGAHGLSDNAPWPTFRHDVRNTGNSGLCPRNN